MDFLTVPPHGLTQGRHIVGGYGLLPNKRSKTYIEFFTQIQNLNPQSLMIDFEQSMVGALDRVYPVSSSKWMFFSFVKKHNEITERIQTLVNGYG